MLCCIDISSSKELDFSLQVFGTAGNNQVEARFMVVGPDFAVTCHCEQIEGGIRVHVPRLEGVLFPGVHRARFEVILGDRIFVPIEDEIELTAPVKITAAMASTEVARPTVTMRMANPGDPAAITTESIKPLFTKPAEKAETAPVIEETKAPEKKQPSKEDIDTVTALLRKKK